MNIRFAAVDERGVEIEDDDENLHPPITHLDSDSVPRVGEKVVFYNLGNNRDGEWTVTAVIWMVGAYRVTEPHNAAAHVCVMIRQERKDLITALKVVWPEPGGDPLEHLRGPFAGLIGPLGLTADDESQRKDQA